MKIKDYSINILNNNYFWLSIILTLIFILRLPSTLETILNVDEGIQFTVAQDIANGGVLYETTWDHKGPFMYFLLTPIIKIFDTNIFAIRIFTSLYLLLTIFFVYLIADKLIKTKTALLAPLIYGLFFTTSIFEGLSSNGELFMMLPAIAAGYFLINYIMDNKSYKKNILLCGFFSCTAFFIKGTAMFTVLLYPFLILIHNFQRKENTKYLTKKMLFYVLGWGICFTILISYFLYHNSLYEFIHTNFIINYKYSNLYSTKYGIVTLIQYLQDILTSLQFDIIIKLSLASFLLISFEIIFNKTNLKKHQLYTSIVLIGLLFLSLAGVAAGKKTYTHYFLQLGFPFALLISQSINMLKLDKKDLNKILPIIIITICIVTAPLKKITFFLNKKKPDQHFAMAISNYIKQHTLKDDYIYAHGYGAAMIHFLAKRKAPTKYFWWTFNTGERLKMLNNQEEVSAAFNKNKPKYFILYRPKDQIEPHLKNFLINNYKLEYQMDIVDFCNIKDTVNFYRLIEP